MTPGTVPVIRSETEVEHHELTQVPVSMLALSLRSCQSSLGGMFMGEGGTPISILAVYEGLATGHQKVMLQSDQEPSIIDVKNKAGTHIPTKIVYEESPVGHGNYKIVQKETTGGQIGAMMGLDNSTLKWHVRHAAWTLTTFHVGGDRMSAHQRIRGKPLKLQIAAFGELILSKPHKTSGPQTRCEVAGRLLARIPNAYMVNTS